MDGPRALKAPEFDSLCALVNTVFRSDGKGRMEEQYPLLFAPENFDHLFVMADGDRVVSHVGALTRDVSVLGHRFTTMSIGAVATYESHRGQGLATKLMEAAIRKARGQGASLMPISGGRGLYRRLGAKRAGRYAAYAIRRGVLPAARSDARLAKASDLTAMTQLYAKESSRYVRSTTDLRRAVEAAWICDRDGETMVIREDGRPVAYAAIQKPRVDRDEEGGRARIAEIAGSRAALVRALPVLLDRYGAGSLEIVTTAADLELASLLRSRGITASPQGFTGTVLVLDPARLLRAFEGYVRDMLGTDGLTWDVTEPEVVFRSGDQSHSVAAADLAQLVFGVAPPDEDPVETMPPGPLRTALESVFPLQLPWYGFNFV